MSPLWPISLCKVIGDGRRLFSAALLHDKHSGAQTQTIRRHPLPNKHPDYTKRQARRACLLFLICNLIFFCFMILASLVYSAFSVPIKQQQMTAAATTNEIAV